MLMRKLSMVAATVAIIFVSSASWADGNPFDAADMQMATDHQTICAQVSTPAPSGTSTAVRCANCTKNSFQYVTMSGYWIMNGASAPLTWNTIESFSKTMPPATLCQREFQWDATNGFSADAANDRADCIKTINAWRAESCPAP